MAVNCNHTHDRVGFGQKNDNDRCRSVGEKAGVALARGHGREARAEEEEQEEKAALTHVRGVGLDVEDVSA